VSTPTASSRSLGAILLILFGATGAAIGLFFAASGVASIAVGFWFGHSGGLPLLVFGLAFSGLGFWAAKRGLRVYREVVRDASTSK
jgi:hypothetical protein